jgi:hypothetical protein
MTEKMKRKKPKLKLTRKEAIKKGNKEFKHFARELAKSINIDEVKKQNKI